VSYPYCYKCEVEAGFHHTWEKVKPGVMGEVWRLHKLYPKYDIVITGHSLGGAVATLAAVDIYYNVSGNVFSWTLGSPRVGNGHFAEWYPTCGIQHTQRITNWKDVVPHLPNEMEFYKHVPQEVWEQKNPNQFVVCDPNNGEDPHCADSVTIPDSVYDHLNYFGLYESC